MRFKFSYLMVVGLCAFVGCSQQGGENTDGVDDSSGGGKADVVAVKALRDCKTKTLSCRNMGWAPQTIPDSEGLPVAFLSCSADTAEIQRDAKTAVTDYCKTAFSSGYASVYGVLDATATSCTVLQIGCPSSSDGGM